MTWNTQDMNLRWYIPKANVDHTISGQGTAVSTLDHSATTPKFNMCTFKISWAQETVHMVPNFPCIWKTYTSNIPFQVYMKPGICQEKSRQNLEFCKRKVQTKHGIWTDIDLFWNRGEGGGWGGWFYVPGRQNLAPFRHLMNLGHTCPVPKILQFWYT